LSRLQQIILTGGLGGLIGTPTKRKVSKRQVSKHLVSKRPLSKRQVYKTSGLQNVRFTKRQVSKRPVFKFDILIKQKV
jgi:hypothetical protein